MTDEHAEHARALLPTLEGALDWTPARLAEHRRSALRGLIAAARAGSAWHRDRLVGVDLEAPFEEMLAAVPPMTKTDLMANFDGICTVPGLTRDVVEANLAGQPEAGYLPGGYTAIASSGSSGVRGIFVYDWTGLATYGMSHVRRGSRAFLSGVPVACAIVMAGHPTHASAACARSFPGLGLPAGSRVAVVPVTLPLAEQIAALEAASPDWLSGYSSALHRLAVEALAGRLRIRPRQVGSSGEPLLPETRALIEAAWGVSPRNSWGASEGGALADTCTSGGLHLSEDLHVVEPLDRDGCPVPAGTEAAKLLLTNLYNHALPLIRYELTDQVRVLPEPCPCGSAHRAVADLAGRLDEHFDYGGVVVHPHAIRSELSRHPELTEYQVRQTPIGIDVTVCAVGELDLAALTADLERALRVAGLREPRVSVSVDVALPRGRTGKLARFVPLRP